MTKEKAIEVLRRLCSLENVAEEREAVQIAIMALEEHPAIFGEQKIIQQMKERAIVPAADDEPFILLDDAIRIVQSAGAEQEEA